MSEQNQNDKQMNDYLAGKSAISRLYQQIETDEPSPGTDAKILSAAKDSHDNIAKIAIPKKQNWPIPAAIAALLILGVSVFWWQYTRIPEPVENIQSAAPPHETVPLQQLEGSLQEYATAEEWLDAILKLHQAGNRDLAGTEFRKFRQTYPTYRIEAERFKALQEYEK